MKDYKLPKNKTPFDKFRFISPGMIKFFIHEIDSVAPAIYILDRGTHATLEIIPEGKKRFYLNLRELL